MAMMGMVYSFTKPALSCPCQHRSIVSGISCSLASSKVNSWGTQRCFETKCCNPSAAEGSAQSRSGPFLAGSGRNAQLERAGHVPLTSPTNLLAIYIVNSFVCEFLWGPVYGWPFFVGTQLHVLHGTGPRRRRCALVFRRWKMDPKRQPRPHKFHKIESPSTCDK